MARRNRKKRQIDASGVPFRTGGLVLVVVMAGLAYVWLGSQTEKLGTELKALETEQALLSKKYLNEEYRWSRIKSPRSVVFALGKRGINMDWPRSDQLVRLSDSFPELKRWGDLGPDALKFARIERTR